MLAMIGSDEDDVAGFDMLCSKRSWRLLYSDQNDLGHDML